MRKTKIVCTLGPASASEETIRELMLSGLNVARFNFSHGTHESHLETFKTVEKLRNELGVPVATMLDTKGPEVRLCKFSDGRATLTQGSAFTLTADGCPGDDTKVQISYPGLAADVRPGDRILLDDGLIELTVADISGGEIRCIVRNSGTVSDNKGVNLPGIRLSMPYISEKDYGDIVFAAETGFEFIAASFVRCADDVLEIKEILKKQNAPGIRVIAKIENSDGVANIDDILRVADGIMIARGDMGVEIALEEIPVLQKLIIKKCQRMGKEVITATQMLESMVSNPRPTRAEATDVANAIYDGTSAIMLSGETAAGKYPVQALKTMATIAERTERDIDYLHRFRNLDIMRSSNVTAAIAHATCSTAYELGAAAIITVTSSGNTARSVSRYRPGIPVVGCARDDVTYRQLSLSWGVIPLLIHYIDNTDDLISYAVGAAQNAGVVTYGDLAVIAAGLPTYVAGSTNLLKVQIVGDVLVTGRGMNDLSVSAPVCVVKNEKEALLNFNQNDILVIPHTSNELLGIMKKASGLITEQDGSDSHAAVAGLALNIPVVVGAENATSILKSGVIVTLDAKKGMVRSVGTGS